MQITESDIDDLIGIAVCWISVDSEKQQMLAALDRLAELESAVAFKGFDELPSVDEIIADRKNGVEKRIELKCSDGSIIYNISVTLHNADFYVSSGLTGWRYSVGDLS